MTESAPLYGVRFLEELRRLTGSTGGVTYAEVMRLQAMGRADVVALLANRAGFGWVAELDAESPEQLASGIVAEMRRRDARNVDRAWVYLILELFAPL